MILQGLFLTLMAFSNQGHELGNGGDAVVCHDPHKTPKTRAELLDVFEAREIHKFDLVKYPKGTKYLVIVEDALEQLSGTLEDFAPGYMSAAKSFENESSFVTGIKLIDIPDSNHPLLPKSCVTEQVVNQNRELLPLQKRYIVDQELWDLFDERSKAGIVLHEILFRQVLGSKDSRKIRYLVGILMSKDWGRLTSDMQKQFVFDVLEVRQDSNGFIERARAIHGNYAKYLVAGKPSENMFYPLYLLKNASTKKISVLGGTQIELIDGFAIMESSSWDSRLFENPFSLSFKKGSIVRAPKIRIGKKDFDIDFEKSLQIGDNQLLFSPKFSGKTLDVENVPGNSVRLNSGSSLLVDSSGLIGGDRICTPNIIHKCLVLEKVVEFHPNGQIKRADAELDHVYVQPANGKPIKVEQINGREIGNGQSGLYFHDNGRIKYARLMQNANLQTKSGGHILMSTFYQLNELEFDKDGYVIRFCNNYGCNKVK